MRNKKFMIPCIKGFGDAILSCNFASRLEVGDYIIITSKKNECLVKGVLPSNSMIFTIDWLEGTFELFSLSKFRISSLFRFIKIRKILKVFCGFGFEPLIDVNNFRNKILYYGLNGYFPKIKNVYQHYSSILSQNFYEPVNSSGKILIFPFGSQPERCMSKELISSISQVMNLNNVDHKVIVHISELEKLVNFYDNYIAYENPNELANLINQASLIISVDSFPLHMAAFKNKEIIVVTNSYNVFIPPILINENKIFQFDKIAESLKKLVINKNT